MDSLQDLAKSSKLEHEVALSSLPPTPSKSATAFTIDFDDVNNNQLDNSGSSTSGQKRNFERGNSLNDSLRKYAPEKIEKLTKLKLKDEDGNIKIRASDNHTTDRSNLSDGASFLIQKMFLTHKTNSHLSSFSSCSPSHKSNKVPHQTNQKLSEQTRLHLSSSAKSSPLRLRHNSNELNRSESATSCKSKSKGSKSNDQYRSPPPIEMDSGVCVDEDDENGVHNRFGNLVEQQVVNHSIDDEDDDALSETGTYTVELDNHDSIAEEARKRIDEIFGTKEIRNMKKQQLDSVSNSSSNNSSKPNSKHSFKIGSICKTTNHDMPSNKKNEFKQKNGLHGSTERLSFRDRRSSLQQQVTTRAITTDNVVKRADSFCRSSSSTVKSNNFSKPPLASKSKKSPLNQNINLINQNNTFVFNCNNNQSSNSLLNRARANSITRSTGLTKKLSNKKDHRLSKDDDTGSIRSEDASTAGSTDLSSLNSEKCKSETGQTSTSLRFNRAFALRRARLGIDTPPLAAGVKKTSKNSSNISKSNSNNSNNRPNSQTSISHIPITSASNHQSRNIGFGFDRSDGGRYSLRTSSASSCKPLINNSTNSRPKVRQSNTHSNHQNLQQANSSQSLNKHPSSSLINAISASKEKVVKKIIKKNSFVIDDTDCLRTTSHVRANSFNGNSGQASCVTKPVRLSSAASTSSNNTMSNASTSEDLSNISEQMNSKTSVQHLAPSILQLSRRIYSTKPHYIAQTNSFTSKFRSKFEENNVLCSFATGSNGELAVSCDQQLNDLSPTSLCLTEPKKKFGQLSTSSTPQPPLSHQSLGFNSSNVKSLSALDYLVLGAVHQLSFKLRCKLRSILDVEKNKYPPDNENRILIEELLPQVNMTEHRNSESSDKTISRDLSNVLKNLKRIEQSLEVINLLLESNSFMKNEEDSSTTDDLCTSKDALLTNDNFSLEL